MTDPSLLPFDRRAIPPEARESLWHAPDGHPIRRIDWAGGDTPRGSLLFFPGRGDCYEKYLETLDHWHRQGWRVTSADWRGQAGSGRLGNDGVTGHIDDFSTWVADLAAFWSAWTRETPGPHVIAAHSMGGHIVTRALVDRVLSPAPAAAILSAPMLGFLRGGVPVTLYRATAKAMCALGDPKRQAWKLSEKPGEMPADRMKLLTHDPDRYEDEMVWRRQRPELAMGPGSWGWVERALASMAVIDAPGALEAVTTPVLIVATGNDKLVAIADIDRAARRLPHGELVRFGNEARHEVLRECDAVRDRVLAAIDAFLAVAAPAGG